MGRPLRASRTAARRTLAAGLALACAAFCGCATADRLADRSAERSGETVAALPEGVAYAAGFEAAVDTLRAMRFELDRIDAAAGIVTTLPKGTAGLATPWDAEQSSLSDETEDLLHDQRRTVRVTFAPDRRGFEVLAWVERRVSVGDRPDPTSVRLGSRAQDPALAARGMWPSYYAPVRRDPALERRLAAAILTRAGSR